MSPATDCDLETFEPQQNTADSWSVAFSWITNCVVNHKLCSPIRCLSRNKPFRVIAVGSREDYSDVCLCLTAQLDPDFSYVSLSHCWGSDGIKTVLTEGSEEPFKECIAWESLQTTFEHAIQFTRRLRAVFGIQYLWIDALCILQDAKDEWFKESSKMLDIYRFAFRNLAACAGSNSESGLFRGRDSFYSHTCVIQAAIDGPSATFFEVENRMSLLTNVHGSYLESRAGVLQEILLAPRVLYFAHQQWTWECAQPCAREKAPTEYLLGFPRKRRALDILIRDKNDARFENYDHYRGWMNTVHGYTERRLTRSQDKLVAISGLAKQLSAKLKVEDEYVAGLWKIDLLLHMYWGPTSGQQESRPQPYRAP